MTHTPAALWRFHKSVESDRVERLLGYRGFDDIVRELQEAPIVNFAWESFTNDRLKGCHRAAFLLCVNRHLYDAFFNSPVGYRAQYAVSTTNGEAANRSLLTSLESRLIVFASHTTLVPESLVRVSLRCADAKTWVYEKEKDVEAQLGGEAPSIMYEPWQVASEDGVGLLSPVGMLLEIKGGWLDGSGIEQRDPYKASRSTDIHRVGFS